MCSCNQKSLNGLNGLVTFSKWDADWVEKQVQSKCPCKNYHKYQGGKYTTLAIIDGIYSYYMKQYPGFQYANDDKKQKDIVMNEAVRKLCADSPDYTNSSMEKMWYNPPKDCFTKKTEKKSNPAPVPNDNTGGNKNSESNPGPTPTDLNYGDPDKKGIIQYLPYLLAGGVATVILVKTTSKKGKMQRKSKRNKRSKR